MSNDGLSRVAVAGVLIVNIVARSETLYAEAIAAIAAVFPVVLEMSAEEVHTGLFPVGSAHLPRRAGCLHKTAFDHSNREQRAVLEHRLSTWMWVR